MPNRKVIANLHATSHIQNRCNTFDQINKMQEFKDWKEFINRILINSGQFENPTSDIRNTTEIETFKLTDKDSLTEIRVDILQEKIN